VHESFVLLFSQLFVFHLSKSLAQPVAHSEHGFAFMSWIRPWSRWLSRNAWWLLALAPFLFLAGVVVRYNVPVPFLDQWDLVPMLEKSYRGQLTFADLWELHNEHRALFPRAFLLCLARLTSWDIRYEFAANLLLAVGIFAVLSWQVRRTARDLGRPELRWAVPLVSVIVFSLSQYQNWLWGITLHIFLSVLALLSSLVLLARPAFHWGRFVAAALLGVIASYSFGNGGLVWPLGLLLLSLAKPETKAKKPSLVAWSIIGVLTMGFYFYHYERTEEHPPLTLLFQHPIQYLCYAFKFLGNICAEYPGTNVSLDGACALVYGLGATLVLAWAVRTLLRHNLVPLSIVLPYLGLGSYSVTSALLIGVGRLGMGSDQALMSRYCTITAPLWFSVVILLILLTKTTQTAPGSSSETRNEAGKEAVHQGRPAQWLLPVTVVLLILGSVLGLDGAERMSRVQEFGLRSLLNLAANPSADIDSRGLGLLHPRPAVVVQLYPFLKQHHLSVFRDQEPGKP
jgi:hypothetical protein